VLGSGQCATRWLFELQRKHSPLSRRLFGTGVFCELRSIGSYLGTALGDAGRGVIRLLDALPDAGGYMSFLLEKGAGWVVSFDKAGRDT